MALFCVMNIYPIKNIHKNHQSMYLLRYNGTVNFEDDVKTTG